LLHLWLAVRTWEDERVDCLFPQGPYPRRLGCYCCGDGGDRRRLCGVVACLKFVSTGMEGSGLVATEAIPH
jgi:hypothetical protein